MSPRAREQLRLLHSLPPEHEATGRALLDLGETPGGLFSARFVGEVFYGLTEAEALAKAREFATDCGPDMLRTFEDEGAAVQPLPTE